MSSSRDGRRLEWREEPARYTLSRLRQEPVGTDTGLAFDFDSPELSGRLYYGFRPGPDEVGYVYTIFFNQYAPIRHGTAHITISDRMAGKYDIVNWQESGVIRLGYRVVNEEGTILYDGKIRVRGTGPFAVDTSIVEGPFVNMVTHAGAVISFETNRPLRAAIEVLDRRFQDDTPSTQHEIALTGLEPDAEYEYTVHYGPYADTYSMRTAPMPGSRKPFAFAYASDGRGNQGGGERNIWGVNAYILKRIGSLCRSRRVSFLQFTGDLIDGYCIDSGNIKLQYANWKRAAEPYAAYLPFVAGFGNHESLLHQFAGDGGFATVDKFPYAKYSAEALFARLFVNPRNGPSSEDGAIYDPDPETVDFPSYEENVYYYTYDNVAIVVLNSNYWFSPTIRRFPGIGGNVHGYVMDQQLAWLKRTLGSLERDDNIDHVFVTIHTPIFPNGGHVKDDMWYSGNNDVRPTVAGEPVEYGIIERRDQLLDVMLHHSTKVVASLTGDEHNYSLLRVTPDMPRYPDGWTGDRLTDFRPFWHINNGAAGAPYYGREKTPWEDHVREFSTQNAVVIFHVHGKSVRVEVINPDTMELLDEFDM